MQEYNFDARLHLMSAYQSALKLRQKTSENRPETPYEISICKHDIFWPRIKQVSEKSTVYLSYWTCRQLQNLHLTHLKNISSPPLPVFIGCGLTWLILHEFQHAELGHFKLLKGVPTLHLVSRGQSTVRPVGELPKHLWCRVGPCLELQADHDAIELMLGIYSRDGWGEMRTKIASIAAVMMLIEKTGEENQIEHSTHPKAATRIFQLLGHVTEMWSLPAHAKAKARGETTICEDDLPSDEEKQAFRKEVILSAFWDAVALAEVAEAKSIISDLGSPEDFFADVARAKLGQWDELVTVGAIEWAELKDTNDLILPLLPINGRLTLNSR